MENPLFGLTLSFSLRAFETLPPISVDLFVVLVGEKSKEKIAILWFPISSLDMQAEINYLGQLHHPNLVKLIGYCFEDDQRLLVYEFMPKGSMENHLFRSEFFT